MLLNIYNWIGTCANGEENILIAANSKIEAEEFLKKHFVTNEISVKKVLLFEEIADLKTIKSGIIDL